jgi:protease-4
MKGEKFLGGAILILFVISIILSVIILKDLKKEKKAEAKTKFESIFKPAKIPFYPDNTIAVLNIFSTISYVDDSSYFGLIKSGAVYWLEKLKSIEDQKGVKAVILRINSPGGTIGATQEIYNEILRLKQKGKVVVVSMGDIAASGAYYIACAADYIVANPGTLTGSIGVIIYGIEVSDLFKKIGISYNVIKSGKIKDILSPYRKMTDEEQKLLTALVMDAYQQFFDVVANSRKIDREKLKEIADGRIFTGKQALEAKLIDEIGDFEKAIEVAKTMAKISGKPNIIDLDFERNILQGLFSILKKNKTINIFERMELDSPVLYLFSL